MGAFRVQPRLLCHVFGPCLIFLPWDPPQKQKQRPFLHLGTSERYQMDRTGGGSHFPTWGMGSEMLVFSYLLPNFDFRDLWEESRVAQFLFYWCAKGKGGHALHLHSLPIHSVLCSGNLGFFHILFWTSFSFVERDSF